MTPTQTLAAVWRTSGEARNPGGSWSTALIEVDPEFLQVSIGDGPGETIEVDLADIVEIVQLGDFEDDRMVVEISTADHGAVEVRASSRFVGVLLQQVELRQAAVRPGSLFLAARSRVSSFVADHERGVRVVCAGVLFLLGLVLLDLGAVFFRVERVSVKFPNAADQASTWLLVGSDSREAVERELSGSGFGTTMQVPGERADVVLLAQSRGDRPPKLVSLPRDLIVFRQGVGVDRLALTLLDGPTGLSTSICRSLGIPVDHVVVVHFDGMARLVDAVGGIDVTSEQMVRDRYTGLVLRPGTQRLDGNQAVAWVRSRHIEVLDRNVWIPDVASDDGRQARQRTLLTTVVRKASQKMRNPVEAQRLAWIAAEVLTVDQKVNPLALAGLADMMGSDPQPTAIPHYFEDGPIPIAQLTAEAAPVIEDLRGGRKEQTPCPSPRISGQ